MAESESRAKVIDFLWESVEALAKIASLAALEAAHWGLDLLIRNSTVPFMDGAEKMSANIVFLCFKAYEAGLLWDLARIFIPFLRPRAGRPPDRKATDAIHPQKSEP